HLVYQPIVALDSGAVVEAEALLRWHHPEFGLVSNLDFIPLAERTGTIQAIGAWVFDAVARQIAAWDRAGCPPLRVSIN
ncbi:EAL domain-containing protein, partial [Enterococcus faecalis]|uniref:EAL domain-containing protein n=1 Tax=Enterococcus faecalis TaxID=1351 RepID=UPI00403F82E8